MTYQVIAFDLDGTLINSQGDILPENIEAIDRVRAEGIKVVIVTGRHHTAAKPYWHQLNLDTPVICCNGTYIYDYQQQTALVANPLSWSQVCNVVDIAEKNNIHLLMYTSDAMAFRDINPHMAKFIRWANSYPEEIRPNLRRLNSFYEPLAAKETVWKFVISDPNVQLMHDVVAQLPEDEFSCEWSWVDRVDIANIGNTKGKRLLELLDLWKVDPQNVIAVGDNYNDISMIKAVGLGVAMGNAESAVKQVAKVITTDNDHAGIADILTQYC